MKRGTIINILSIAFIGAASAFVLLRADPEYVATTSADGAVLVTGFAHEGGFTVTEDAGTAYGMTGTVYTVAPHGAVRELPVRLVFARVADAMGVVRYNDTLSLWEWQETQPGADGYLTLSTTQLGMFAVLPSVTVTAPDFVAVYDELRDNAPQTAVGYRIAVGYAVNDGPRIRLDGVGQQGGCNGAVQPGEDTAYATMTRAASVLVNDVQTPVTFTFVASWYVVDGGTCPEGQTFEASDEYGILPSSL